MMDVNEGGGEGVEDPHKLHCHFELLSSVCVQNTYFVIPLFLPVTFGGRLKRRRTNQNRFPIEIHPRPGKVSNTQVSAKPLHRRMTLLPSRHPVRNFQILVIVARLSLLHHSLAFAA